MNFRAKKALANACAALIALQDPVQADSAFETLTGELLRVDKDVVVIKDDLGNERRLRITQDTKLFGPFKARERSGREYWRTAA